MLAISTSAVNTPNFWVLFPADPEEIFKYVFTYSSDVEMHIVTLMEIIDRWSLSRHCYL